MLLRSRMEHMRVGAVGTWRVHSEPMQVVSGPVGKIKVHFEAPPSKRVPKEMHRFIRWFNSTAPSGRQEIKRAAVRSALALSEKALSQGLGYPVLLSLSKIIEADKKKYYAALQHAQRSNEITAWIVYFVDAVLAAQIDAEQQIDFVLKKTKFFDRYASQLDESQLKAIRRMLEEGPQSFAGGMNTKKYIGITGVSKATATRDLQHLHGIGILQRVGAGRSTRYELVF